MRPKTRRDGEIHDDQAGLYLEEAKASPAIFDGQVTAVLKVEVESKVLGFPLKSLCLGCQEHKHLPSSLSLLRLDCLLGERDVLLC